MSRKKRLSIVVQSTIALAALAAITRAQTDAVSPTTQSPATNATAVRQSEKEQPADAGHTIRPANRLSLDLRAKTKTANVPQSVVSKEQFAAAAKSEFINKAFPLPSAAVEPLSESTEPQEPKAAAPAASNGTNPAELITRVEVKYQYQNFASGHLHGIAIIRGDYAFTPKAAFRMDLPILHFDSKIPGQRSESGIGDIVTSMTFVKIFSRRFVGAVVPRIDFPPPHMTASVQGNTPSSP